MKNIFIVTDFSEASINAGWYGVELARHFKAKVFLFHAYQSPVEIPESYIFYTPEKIGEESIDRLIKEAAIINKYKVVDIQICAREGLVANAILAEAKKVEADLIICGMKGNGKTLKKIFGSTSTSLARKTTVPLIIVPEDLHFRLPHNIAFASDVQTIPTEQQIQTLREIGEQFDSKLSIVSVVNGEWNTHFQFREHYLDFIHKLKIMRPTLECLQGPDISSSLEKYIEDNFINMIAMVPHAHRFLERIFSGSITTKMAFLSHVPLLILPEKQTTELDGKQGATSAVQKTGS